MPNRQQHVAIVGASSVGTAPAPMAAAVVQPTLQDLLSNTDLAPQIISLCDSNSLAALRLTSPRPRACIDAHISAVSWVTKRYIVPHERLAGLCRFPRLAAVRLYDVQLFVLPRSSNIEERLAMRASGLRHAAAALALGQLPSGHGPQVESPVLPHLRELDLTCTSVTAEAIEVLVRGSFPLLERLSLAGCASVGDQGAAALAGAAWPHLVDLEIAGISQKGIAALACAYGPQMRKLRLEWGDLEWGEDCVEELVGSPWPRLEALNLMGQELGPIAVAGLARIDAPCLRHLNLQDNELREEGGMVALMAGTALAGLQELDLSGNHLDEGAAAALARACLPQLTSLSVSIGGLLASNTAGAAAALGGGRWPLLETLVVDMQHHGDFGDDDKTSEISAVALFRTAAWPLLRSLRYGGRMGPEGAAALAAAGFTKLRRLAVEGALCVDAPAAAAALAAAPWKELTALSLDFGRREGMCVIASAAWAPNLRELKLVEALEQETTTALLNLQRMKRQPVFPALEELYIAYSAYAFEEYDESIDDDDDDDDQPAHSLIHVEFPRLRLLSAWCCTDGSIGSSQAFVQNAAARWPTLQEVQLGDDYQSKPRDEEPVVVHLRRQHGLPLRFTSLGYDVFNKQFYDVPLPTIN